MRVYGGKAQTLISELLFYPGC